MRIKIPLFEIETDKNCPCKQYDEYEIKLKCMKTKLHSRYIACISVGILTWVLATGQANTKDFADWISFASTITSIILSVTAIILSITGEGKTDAMRGQMEETARKLDNVASNMSKETAEANKEISQLINQLDEQIKILQEKVDKVPEQVSKYSKTNTTYTNTRKKSVKNQLNWGENNEKR